MSEAGLAGPGEENAVARYKSIFRAVLDNRPSGVRLRPAHAMGYPVPIPAQHVATILEVCHFSPTERKAFLEAYGRAHPRHAGRLGQAARERALMLHLPDLGNQKRNAQLDALLQDFARRLIALLRAEK